MVTREPRPDASRLVAAAAVLVAVAIAMRVNSAFRHPLLHGFDEVGNWRFTERLMRSFALPGEVTPPGLPPQRVPGGFPPAIPGQIRGDVAPGIRGFAARPQITSEPS